MFRSRPRLFTRDAVMFYRARSACITAGINCVRTLRVQPRHITATVDFGCEKKISLFRRGGVFINFLRRARARAAYLSIKYSRIKLTSTFRRRRRIANNHKGWIGIFVCRYLCIKRLARIDLLMQRSILINRYYPLCARNQTR